tara:strand:+ start:866 stop:1258 length:393 start_codon:yes stop_codon:yes gene_type:complete
MSNKVSGFSKTVLVVEDERPIANALRLKLTRSGAKVEVVHNGTDALDKIKTHQFDVLLLDLMIPQPDGFEILEMIGQNSNLKKPGKIAVTSNLGQVEDIEKVKKLGAETFFVKADVSLQDIIDWVMFNKT